MTGPAPTPEVRVLGEVCGDRIVLSDNGRPMAQTFVAGTGWYLPREGQPDYALLVAALDGCARLLAAAEARAVSLNDEVYAAGRDIDEAHEKIQELDRHLGDLLAVIHRDGGHYRTEHGDDKATTDAMAVLCAREQRLDEAEARAVSAEGRLMAEQSKHYGTKRLAGAQETALDMTEEHLSKLADAADFTLDALRRATGAMGSETYQGLIEAEARLREARGK